MSRIYIKNKQSFKTLIINILKNDDHETITKNVVLEKCNNKYKTYIQKYTPINDDVINIIYEYTFEEININICGFKYKKYIRFDIKYYKLFDFVIVSEVKNDIIVYYIYTPHIKLNIFNRTTGEIMLNENIEKININNYKESIKKDSECLNVRYTKNNKEFVNRKELILVPKNACNYINFFNEYMKQNYNKEDYIKCKRPENEGGYFESNNYIVYEHNNQQLNYNFTPDNILYYEIIKPINHKKIKEIIVVMKLLINIIKKQLINFKNNSH